MPDKEFRWIHISHFRFNYNDEHRSYTEYVKKVFLSYALHVHFRPKKRLADRLLDRITAWTPIKLREELLGDIREDVEHRREQGWTEKKLRRLIWWQFSYAIVGWLWGKVEPVVRLLHLFGVGKG